MCFDDIAVPEGLVGIKECDGFSKAGAKCRELLGDKVFKSLGPEAERF